MILILFSASYPYVMGAEQNFIENELQYLAEKFERIILVPEKRDKNIEVAHLPAYLEIENEYADIFFQPKKINLFWQGMFSQLAYYELLQKKTLFFKPTYLKRLFFFAGHAEITRRWAISWMQRKNINPKECLFYTYWFDKAATSIALTKLDFPDIKLVSRAHGYDVYEERSTPPYWPCREFTLQYIESLFPDSDAGTNYIKHKYPKFSSRIETARLGVRDYGVITKPSSDGVFRIVSCSRMVPLKRLHLIMDGIQVAAQRNHNQKFEWCHFGTGILQSELQARIPSLPENFRVHFPGYSTQADLFNYYNTTPVDVFVNVSATEGTPVAVMEAISCGIPVIATAVGGNKEIVTNQNGILLSETPHPDEIANSLLLHLREPGSKRQASRVTWQNQYDAHKNFSKFAQRLAKIRES